MFRNLIAFPFLFLVVILQSTVISRIQLLNGYADLMLVVLAAWGLQQGVDAPWQWALLGGLFVGFLSKVPWPAIIFGYLLITLLSRILQRRVWQAPLLAMFSVTFIGTLVVNLLTFSTLQLLGNPMIFGDALGLIILPSLLLNLLFAIPTFYLIRDLARWINPRPEVE